MNKGLYRSILRLRPHITQLIEMIMIKEGSKPVMRTLIGDHELKDYIKVCKDYGLYMKRSPREYKIKDRHFIKCAYYYLSKDKNIAKKAKDAEYVGDDEKFGKLLGYPECCIEFYDRYKRVLVLDLCDSLFPYTFLKTKSQFPYDYRCNYIIREYFGLGLLSHFTCSFNCRKSILLAKEYSSLLKNYSTELIKKIEILQKSIVIFSYKNPLIIITNYNIKNNKLFYLKENILYNKKSDLSKKILNGDNIIVKDKKFQIFKNKDLIGGYWNNEAGIAIFA